MMSDTFLFAFINLHLIRETLDLLGLRIYCATQ